jgi:Domain of unknown function (DUF5078)
MMLQPKPRRQTAALRREEIPMNPPRRSRARSVRRACIAALPATVAISALPATAVADSTDDYPIPRRMIVTACNAEQILAAARDFTPIYYERYMIDKHNKSPQVQQAAIDSAHYFYSLNPADRRAYSEQMVTNFADPMTAAWPNWAKIFFNNKGVAAKETDHCADYPPDDQSVWDWSPVR